MMTVQDVLDSRAHQAKFAADCFAMLPGREADLLEYRAWEREGATLYPEDNPDRVFVAEHSIKSLEYGAIHGWM